MTTLKPFLFLVAVAWIFRWILKKIVIKCPQRNLPGPPPASWLTGDLVQLNGIECATFIKAIFERYGGVVKVNGMCGAERLYISDPLALRELFKVPSLLSETPVFAEISMLIFGQALTSVHGHHHRKQRKILNPLFSPAHLRTLFPIMSHIASQVSGQMEERVAHGTGELDVHDVFHRTTAEIVGQASFGHSFGTIHGANNRYLDSVKNITLALNNLGVFLVFLPVLTKIGPARFRRFVVEFFPWKPSQEFKHLIDTLDQNSLEIFSSRKAELETDKKGNLDLGEKNVITRLLHENLDTSEGDKLSEAEILAQINLLTFASSDTTSGSLGRLFETLSRHPDAQNKLRSEIIGAGQERAMASFEVLNSLPFLDAVVKETLRLYPTLVKWDRTASRDVTVPLHTPVMGLDGQPIKQIVVTKGQTIIIGIAQCNSDPRIWGPDASEWKPERWLGKLPESLITARIPGIYSHLMTFLGGDRACIGYNLALMEIKTVLAALIPKINFELTDAQVEWKSSFSEFPLVKGETTPRLPLKVSLAQRSD